MNPDTRKGLNLLPPEALLKTGEVDHADWNFRPILGSIIRIRYKLILSLLSGRRYRRLLEIGYGSGVFMPELARRCDGLYGIDVHQNQEAVVETLSRFNVVAGLFSGSAEAMPFESGHFDCVVTASTLEFIEDLDSACAEIRRILAPGGSFIAVMPGHSPLLDLELWALTGRSAKADYGDRRRLVIPTLLRHFTVQKKLTVPSIGNSVIGIYTALKLCPG
ncbi:class I SAM-dependent methyltransferase [bacterium]|nr:class I SAM-dependent methyltransferase [bacterium]